MPVREDVHLQRPARGERDKRRPVLALEQHPLGFLLEAEDVLEQRAAVAFDRADQLGRARRDVRVGVDLSVRVVQRHADRFAAVLERKDLLDAGQRRQRGRPVRPGFHHCAHPGQGQARQGAGVLRGEAHHFAPAHGLPAAPQPHPRRGRPGLPARAGPRQVGPEGRGLVFEDGDVVEARNLRGILRRRRGQRVQVRRAAAPPGSAGRPRSRSTRRSGRPGAWWPWAAGPPARGDPRPGPAAGRYRHHRSR